jgi:hypothetical protein
MDAKIYKRALLRRTADEGERRDVGDDTGVGTWRFDAALIIERVLAETKGQPEAAIKKALRDAYPFGERAMWPYKVWLSEIRRQRHTPSRRALLTDAERNLFNPKATA